METLCTVYFLAPRRRLISQQGYSSFDTILTKRWAFSCAPSFPPPPPWSGACLWTSPPPSPLPAPPPRRRSRAGTCCCWFWDGRLLHWVVQLHERHQFAVGVGHSVEDTLVGDLSNLRTVLLILRFFLLVLCRRVAGLLRLPLLVHLGLVLLLLLLGRGLVIRIGNVVVFLLLAVVFLFLPAAIADRSSNTCCCCCCCCCCFLFAP